MEIIETIYKQHQSEENILDTYTTTQATYAIMPARHMDYASIVVEEQATYCIRERPLQIIKNSCKNDWTTFKGRKTAIAKKLGYAYKTPMILNQAEQIYAFPTMSAGKFECSWIFLKHHLMILKEGQKGAVVFNNRHKISLDISFHTLREQLERTQILAYTIEQERKYQQNKI